MDKALSLGVCYALYKGSSEVQKKGMDKASSIGKCYALYKVSSDVQKKGYG